MINGRTEWALTIVVVVCFATLTYCAARAAPPEGVDPESPTAKWYRGLESNTGGSCCSLADCRRVEARHGGPVGGDGSGWQARLDGVWVDIPERAVLHNKENPTGESVACWTNGSARGIYVYCFVKGSET